MVVKQLIAGSIPPSSHLGRPATPGTLKIPKGGIMKTHALLILTTLSLFVMLTATSVCAQSETRSRVNIPLEFSAPGKVLPAGTYAVALSGGFEMRGRTTRSVFQPQENVGDTEGWDGNGFKLNVRRSSSLSDLIFTWEVRRPHHYDVFNVRVRISDGREGQVEVQGGVDGNYRERNAAVGRVYTFLVQGCDKKTFGSNCTAWSSRRYKNDGHQD
jgi:hypothetical protein